MRRLIRYLLSPSDRRALRWTDSYSLHRIVYDLFENVRGNDKQSGSGILFVDKGVKQGMSRVLILSDRDPRTPRRGRRQSDATRQPQRQDHPRMRAGSHKGLVLRSWACLGLLRPARHASGSGNACGSLRQKRDDGNHSPGQTHGKARGHGSRSLRQIRLSGHRPCPRLRLRSASGRPCSLNPPVHPPKFIRK